MKAAPNPLAKRAVLVVDDEAPARERLCRLVTELPGWEVTASCGSGIEAIEAARRRRPDVVLLDIRMPGLNGIEVARHMARLEVPPAVVFTTAFDEFALDAFDSRAVGYVLKPVRRERLAAALEHAACLADGILQSLGTTAPELAARSQIAVRLRDEIRLIPVRDVCYFRADQKYTTVVHATGEDLIDDSLVQLEQEFSARFVRAHRSTLVALDHVDALERLDDGSYRIRIRGSDARLPVSRRQVGIIKARLSARC